MPGTSLSKNDDIVKNEKGPGKVFNSFFGNIIKNLKSYL